MAEGKNRLDPNQQIRSTDSTALFVSLYLVVLAFFILLNTISTQDKKKVEDALASVNMQFTSEDTRFLSPGEELPLSLGKEIILGNFFAQLRKVIYQEIQIEEIETRMQGDVMYAVIPADAVFEPATSQLREEREELFEGLVEVILNPSEPEVAFDLEIILDSSEYLSGESSIQLKTNLEVLRAGVIARKLIEHGIEPTGMYTGVKAGLGESITLVFNGRIVKKSKVTLESEDIR